MTDVQNSKYKRMAKNAGMLYFRMLLTMGVTLYTSRVVLQTLGVDDFGIYHVVAGFVTMLGFLNSAMSSATQRFLAFELGKPGEKDMPGIFSMSLNIHVLIAVFVLVLGETVGLWFVKTQMTIPADRMLAAEWVFHFALLSFMVTIVSVPYNALIIAHERMSVFAWVSIIDVTLKLLIVFMLGWFGVDKLILYGLLNLMVVVVIFLIYRTYCHSTFKDSQFRLYWDRQLFKDMFSYTGWNLWGHTAAIISNQGANILLNIFFGPAINAARALAMQLYSALNNFVHNLQVAVNPQIIKSYATKDTDYMHKLICYGCKYNYFLVLLISMPVLNNIEYLLTLWLGTVPPKTILFSQLAIISVIVDSLSQPLITSVQATGRIKTYQIIVSVIIILNLPASAALFYYGAEPEIIYYVAITLSCILLLVRIYLVSKLISLKVTKFINEVIIPITLVSTTIYILSTLLTLDKPSSLLGLFFSFSTISGSVLALIFLLGLSNVERVFLYRALKKIRRHFIVKA